MAATAAALTGSSFCVSCSGDGDGTDGRVFSNSLAWAETGCPRGGWRATAASGRC